MKIKIFTLLIVITFLLTGFTGLSTLGMKIDISKDILDENPASTHIATVNIWISDIEEHVKVISVGYLLVGGFLSGPCNANINIMYDKVWDPYSISGSWRVRIGCIGIGLFETREYYFYNFAQGDFDYGYSEHPPDWIYENVTIDIEFGYYLVYYSFDIYIDVEEFPQGLIDTILVHRKGFKGTGGNFYNKNNNYQLNNYIQSNAYS